MPELRWTLLLLGALFIAVLAWWERRKPRQSARSGNEPGPPDSPSAYPPGEPALTLPQMRAREAPQELPVVRIGEDDSFPDLRIDVQHREPERFDAGRVDSAGDADGDDRDAAELPSQRRVEPDFGDAIDEQPLGMQPRRVPLPGAHQAGLEPTWEAPVEAGRFRDASFTDDAFGEGALDEDPIGADSRAPRSQGAEGPGATERAARTDPAGHAEPIDWPQQSTGSPPEPYLSDLAANEPPARESRGREPHISGFEAAPAQPAAEPISTRAPAPAAPAATSAPPRAASEPVTAGGSAAQLDATPAVPPVRVPGLGAGNEPIVEWPPEDARRIIALRLVCASPERFSGRAIRTALVAEGFVLGRFSIFHRADATGQAVLSAASLSKPGVFDPETIDTQRFSGLNLFAVLPGPKSAREALEDLLACARNLNERLKGGLQDERGGPLTPSRIAALRESLVPAGPATRG